jgi:hypothetical protein
MYRLLSVETDIRCHSISLTEAAARPSTTMHRRALDRAVVAKPLPGTPPLLRC